MYVTIVHVHVKPEHVADFIESIRANHEASVKEPGNLRFDILQSADDPTRFVAYEAYRDEAGGEGPQGDGPLPRLARHGRRLDGRAAPGRSLRRALPGGPAETKVGRGRRWSRRCRLSRWTAGAGRSMPSRPFSIARLPRILFGAGRVGGAGRVVRGFGTRALVVVAARASPTRPTGLRLDAGLDAAGSRGRRSRRSRASRRRSSSTASSPALRSGPRRWQPGRRRRRDRRRQRPRHRQGRRRPADSRQLGHGPPRRRRAGAAVSRPVGAVRRRPDDGRHRQRGDQERRAQPARRRRVSRSRSATTRSWPGSRSSIRTCSAAARRS